ncbi:unnamed protein product [Prorocentrum cordatum]|uniref:Uncharacterized protein n=1 Tax=Prorocentrum cordatum TaxID=2364126 RepID=A0ABN9S2R8_9DINO|nr:unnamed protein product [Polarella glacialis]
MRLVRYASMVVGLGRRPAHVRSSRMLVRQCCEYGTVIADFSPSAFHLRQFRRGGWTSGAGCCCSMASKCSTERPTCGPFVRQYGGWRLVAFSRVAFDISSGDIGGVSQWGALHLEPWSG